MLKADILRHARDVAMKAVRGLSGGAARGDPLADDADQLDHPGRRNVSATQRCSAG